jgi:hypothetical protein
MGLYTTILKLGYTWFCPQINWEELAFWPLFAERIVFTSSILRDLYYKNRLLVIDAKNNLGRLEAAGRWLQLYSRHLAIRKYVLNFIVLLLMRSYRKEVFRHLKDLVQPKHHKKAASGNIMLC